MYLDPGEVPMFTTAMRRDTISIERLTSTLSKTELLSGTLPPGTRLRNYQLISHLATGGMAELYLARAVGIQNFERVVVIKRILPQWARDPQFVAMFLDEARLAAQLSHPNIAQVFDIGEESGTYFFAMEFVHGEDLRAVLRQNHKDGERLPLELAVSIVIETASALHHAHEANDAYGNSLELVHRDVSPSNVLLSYDGAIKVVDFGIAKAANRQQETRTGCLKGKIAYMAPEQCLGEDLDRRADVFALGILLYEATTGRKCFDGPSDFKTLEMITSGQFTPPGEHVANYPDELESIVRRALATDREIRYQSAESLATHLEVFAAKHGLPLSRRHRGRYLRERFAGKLEAWEIAQRDGQSLASYLSDSMLFSLTPSGVEPMSLTPSGAAVDVAPAAPVFDSQISDPPRSGISKTLLAVLGSAILTAVFVAFVMPGLGWAPWATSASSIERPDRSAETTAQIEAAAKARADAEARADAAEERLRTEAARARVEKEAREKAAALAAAEAAEQVAEKEARGRRRANRKRKRDQASGTATDRAAKPAWEANSPLLPSRSKNKK